MWACTVRCSTALSTLSCHLIYEQILCTVLHLAHVTPKQKLSVWQLWCLYSQSSLIIICILCCGFWRSLWQADLLHIWLCSCVIGSVLVAVWQKTVYLLPALCRCNGYFWVGKGDFFNSVKILSRVIERYQVFDLHLSQTCCLAPVFSLNPTWWLGDCDLNQNDN